MGDNGKENGNYYNGFYGWLSKLWSFFGHPKNIRCRIIIGIQKGTIILTTTHVAVQQVSPGHKTEA